MKITLLTYGSRGDVQPFVALGRGLMLAGHQVRLAAPHNFVDLADTYSVPFIPLDGDPEELSAVLNNARGNVLGMVKNMSDYVRSIAIPVAQVAFAACEDADLIIHSFLFTTGAHSLAKARGLPDVSVQGFPVFAPTRAFPMVASSKIPPGLLSWLSHWFATQLFWYVGNAGFRQLRRQAPELFKLNLSWPWKSSSRVMTPLIFAYSPTVLPKPAEWDRGYIHVPGYFFLNVPASYQPPPELVDYLSDGDLPFCITFGSMVNQDASRINEIVVQALQAAGQRAIFIRGWSGVSFSDFPKEFFEIDSVPHDWLFPKCKAVIHHGGAGTTGAVLRAGIPAITIPHGMDQLFWGKHMAKLGVGVEPIEIEKLSTDHLVKAITEVLSPAMIDRAQKIGKIIHTEDGIAQAIQIIEQHAAEFHNQ